MKLVGSSRLTSFVALAALTVGTLTTAAPASAAVCQSWGTQPPTAANGNHFLLAVSTTSPCNIFAVGSYTTEGHTLTLAEHWNGRSWQLQATPSPDANHNNLVGVAAVSSSDAWAVGSSGQYHTLIEHWNGSTWSRVTSPNPGGNESQLEAVVAISASNVWAVGTTFDPVANAGHTLIVHWNGTSWRVIPSPNRTGDNTLFGIAGSSAANLWAVGDSSTSTVDKTLIEHWNGTSWKLVSSPNSSAGTNNLYAVTAPSSSSAWAVGRSYNGTTYSTLIEHWNGHVWSRQTSLNPGGANHDADLEGVAATSASNAWAVGTYKSGSFNATLIEHWDGHSWSVEPSPNPATGSQGSSLAAIAASSATNAWAVGSYYAVGEYLPFALHCC